MSQDNKFSSSAFPLQAPPRGQKNPHSSRTNECEHVFVTLIRATNVASGLRRMPAGFHVIVEVDGRIIQTSNKPVSTVQDAVEWDEDILLPSNQSSSISFSVYASFELGSRLGNGDLLGQFKITVGEVLHDDQLEFIDFTAQKGDVLPSCSSLRIITKRRICDTNESCPKRDLPESGEMDALEKLTDEGHRALLCYRQGQDQMDLDAAIKTFERVREICPIDHSDRSAVLFNLANAKFINCQANNRCLDLDGPIGLYRSALLLRRKNHPDHCTTVLELGLALLSRFQRRGFQIDREEARDLLAGVMEVSRAESYAYRAGLFALQIAEASVSVEGGEAASSPTEQANDEDVVQETRNLLQSLSYWNPCRPALLADLGVLLFDRFECNGILADIHEAIWMFEYAVDLTPHSHPDMLSLFGHLGSALRYRFNHLGDLADLNKSISMFEEAVFLTPDGHPDKPLRLNNLGSSMLNLFERLGDLADLNKSISMKEQAVFLTPDGHPDKPIWLNNLGNSLLSRFECLGDLADLKKSILIFEEAVCLTPDDHPDKPSRLNNLGSSLMSLFERHGDLADLNKSISMKEQAVFLTPDGHPDKPTWLNNLGNSLQSRFEHLGDLADLNKSISMCEEAVCLTPDGHRYKPSQLNNLGNSLLSLFERLGDLADLNKSILMFKEAVCLTPDGHRDKPSRLNNLGSSLMSRFKRLGDLADLTKSISMKERAACTTPDGHPDKPGRLKNLGNSLHRRFERLGDLADLIKSISMFEEAVCLTPDGHPDKSSRLNTLGSSLMSLFERLGDLADLNKSISIKEQAACMTPDGHPDKPSRLNNLGNSLLSRFERLGDLADLHNSIVMFEEAVCLTPDGHPDKPLRLNNLGSSMWSLFERLGDLADLNKSISMKEQAVFLTPDGHPDKPIWLNNLGNSLQSRFERLGNHADIVKSISIQEEAISLTPNGHPSKPNLLMCLGDAFNIRFRHSHDSSDLSSAALNFSIASRAFIGRASTRFRAARAWISCAHCQGNTTALLDACTSALDLLPQLAWLGLSVTERHRLLFEAADVTRDSVSAALEAGEPELAVEWLEQGRSIVWNQFLQLRTPVDELQVDYPALAHQFQHVSRELEHASSRNPSVFQQFANDLTTHTRSLEDEVQRHLELATNRDKLLIEIRSLYGFDRFLLPKTIKQLAGLANSGPVIYLNASKYRCDALIVTAGLENVVSVVFPDISYQDVVLMQCLLLKRNFPVISRDEILALMPSEDTLVPQNCLDTFFKDCIEDHDREGVLRIEGYSSDDRLRWILAFLWKRVVRPILETLNFSTPPYGTEKMTRIFWCPTGPFSFLPIHAAGLYGAAQAGEKLSDFVISSYIPTLSALAPSAQNVSNDLSSTVRLLLVPQPPEDGKMKLPCVREEIDSIKSLSVEDGPVEMQDSHGVVEDVMEKMANADWVHFACHGVQDLKTPLDSGLCLANNRRLTLSDIIQLSRPQGGFAFLSACQTARGDEKLSEESVHLAAGMLLAGYSSVIATMWSIMDRDAPKVTRDVYEHLFRDHKVPDSTEAAEALHRAVRRLRESGVPFSSWVPFIHVGR